jgi:hypothetical protein
MIPSLLECNNNAVATNVYLLTYYVSAVGLHDSVMLPPGQYLPYEQVVVHTILTISTFATPARMDRGANMSRDPSSTTKRCAANRNFTNRDTGNFVRT